MSFPASVHTVHLTRARGGRPRKEGSGIDNGSQDQYDLGPGGPVLDFGRDGGARLIQQGKRWRWVWANEPDGEDKLELKEDAKLLYPGTRLLDPPAPPHQIVLDSARQYLEKTCPDIVLGEVGIPPEIQHEIQHGMDSLQDDIYKGKILELVHNPRANLGRTVMCFPTGQLGSHLNVSPFLPPSNAPVFGRSDCRFVPRARPALRFPNTILQICSSPITQPRLNRDATVLGIRLHSFTHLVKLIPNPSYLGDPDDPACYAEIMATLSSRETGGRRHVDLVLDPTTWSRALIVDDSGAVWFWWEERSELAEKVVVTYRTRHVRNSGGNETDGSSTNGWYNVAFGTRPGTALVVSRKQVTLLDIESDKPVDPIILITLEGQREFVGIEKTAMIRGVTYTLLCTTKEIMLIDDHAIGPPVLSLMHNYGSGQQKDLEMSFIRSEDHGDCTFLSSRSNPLVMVFRLSFDPPVRSLTTPYSLHLPLSSMDKPLQSFNIIRLSRWRPHRRSHALLGMSCDGSLWAMPVQPSKENTSRSSSTRQSSPLEYVELKVDWDPEIKALAKSREIESTAETWNKIGHGRGVTRYQSYDARWAWLEINMEPFPQTNFHLREFEQYLREIEAPFEQFMTAGDLAQGLYRRAKSKIRCSSLLPLPLVERPAELDRLAQLDYARHFNVIASRSSASLAELQALFPHLSPNVAYRKRHRAHLLRLALDLALSKIILHTDDFGTTSLDSAQGTSDTAEDDDVARAAGRLTLSDNDPPSIAFSILEPKLERAGSVEPGADTSSTDIPGEIPTVESLQTITARTLLAEWTSADPKSYTWTPWRDTRESSTSSISRPVKPLPSPRATGQQSGVAFGSSSQPPLLAGAGSVPILRVAPPVTYMTQVPPSSSQDPMPFAQTQVERGPFGARSGGGGIGKKKAKKRVGGF
ncbi:hypothetical protein BD324DRAFT_104438 [Kockovaella imperatae]|uniref:RNA polymerase I-specific transcription initiation factor RRN6-like protein n=1 Tax=Kockovaella imperatae TaxID=4999 RepID=A0A1Y1UA66_9TREE|nr:hypothetical protein BD324DRAFT_104438 [Kockovaella imperatae]ORX34919.1 hypothetical protein BD324DRAFT_104438 [Kockovaella imperatae]